MVNEELVYEVYKARHAENCGLPKKRYSFVLGKFLGEHGEVPDHELIGKTVVSRKSGTEYKIVRVYLQYYANGYYWQLSCVNDKGEWLSKEFGTLNCTNKIITECVARFNYDFSIQ